MYIVCMMIVSSNLYTLSLSLALRELWLCAARGSKRRQAAAIGEIGSGPREGIFGDGVVP